MGPLQTIWTDLSKKATGRGIADDRVHDSEHAPRGLLCDEKKGFRRWQVSVQKSNNVPEKLQYSVSPNSELETRKKYIISTHVMF